MLTSPKNPKVAAVTRLKKRAYREEDGRFLVEGAQGVDEALGHPEVVHSVFATDDLHPLAVRARQVGVEVEHVSDELMKRLTSTVTPQGIMGVASYLDVGLEALGADGCVAVLHEVRDPGNAGTVLRSADAAGAGGVVFTATSVDIYNPKTVRASAGSLFHLPVVRGVDVGTATEHLRTRGFRILAMAADGEQTLYGSDLSSPIAFVFGNEAHGLSREVVERADLSVRVPHRGRAESLNLAAAATVCLFEWARQRDAPSDTLEHVITAAAHDIRSPLTALKGFGYALEKRWESMPADQRGLMLQGIVYDADRMDTILRQLVDAARVLSGGLETYFEGVRLSELVASIVETHRRDPEAPEIVWASEDAYVIVDPSRLRGAILAFIEALVWWAREGPITITASVSELLRVTASRAGTELTTPEADALFGPREPGAGAGSKIGLFVTRRVAEAQGGGASADVVDGLLRFHVEMPVRSQLG